MNAHATPTPAGSDEQRLRTLIAHIARVAPDAFGADDDLRATLGLDSLSALRVAAGVEREFGITIPDDALESMPTVRGMLEYVRGKE